MVSAVPKNSKIIPASCSGASGVLANVVLRSVVMGDPSKSMVVAVVTLIYFSPW